MRRMNVQLLLVEDDPDMADLLSQLLEFEGFYCDPCCQYRCGEKALAQPLQLALLDGAARRQWV